MLTSARRDLKHVGWLTNSRPWREAREDVGDRLLIALGRGRVVSYIGHYGWRFTRLIQRSGECEPEPIETYAHRLKEPTNTTRSTSCVRPEYCCKRQGTTEKNRIENVCV